MALDLDDPVFVFGEAVEITGFDPKALNNYTQREILDLGVMHRTGRRLFSLADLIRLAIVARLAPAMRPAFAVAVGCSDVIGPRIRVVAALDDENNLKHRGYDGKDEPQYVVGLIEKDNFKVARCGESKLIEATFGKPGVDSIQPATVIPLDFIAKTIALKAVAVLKREEEIKQSEQPSNVHKLAR